MAGTNSPAAAMGYIGGVSIFGQFVRVTSASLSPKQKINPTEVVDGTVDHTLYSLGPVEIDGDIRLPVVTGGGFESFIWGIATERNLDSGELVHKGEVKVEYFSGKGRTYNGCLINSLDFSAEAGATVEASMNIWGTEYSDGATVPPSNDPPGRLLQWSDISISGADVDGCIVKSFKLTIANNLSRNYTFCDASGLFPNNISTGKRMISGSLTFQGYAPTDGSADTNRNRNNPDASLSLTIGKISPLEVSFPQLVWEYQTIESQVGLITSSANFYPFASGGGTVFNS